MTVITAYNTLFLAYTYWRYLEENLVKNPWNLNPLNKGTIAICYFGNAKWKQKGREEQALPDGTDMMKKAASLLGVDAEYLIDTFMKPKLKVNNSVY